MSALLQTPDIIGNASCLCVQGAVDLSTKQGNLKTTIGSYQSAIAGVQKQILNVINPQISQATDTLTSLANERLIAQNTLNTYVTLFDAAIIQAKQQAKKGLLLEALVDVRCAAVLIAVLHVQE